RLLVVSLSISGLFCCDIPPSAWCQNDQIDEKCNITQQCRKYKSEMSGRKFQIQLLYETLCPDCQNFIKRELKREYWKIAREFVEFEFLPYGNAKQLSTSGDIQCQHGALECSLNKLHSCAIKYLANDNR
uniref:Saposin A-type domain-containing protein n=1 Tax=Romanomermis culicivorax TaxID=13658 RepID=A0A915HIB2_ROMCU